MKADSNKRCYNETESQRRNRLDAQNEETDSQKQWRLESRRQNYKRKKLGNSSNLNEPHAQKQSLDAFDSTENGMLHEQN